MNVCMYECICLIVYPRILLNVSLPLEFIFQVFFCSDAPDKVLEGLLNAMPFFVRGGEGYLVFVWHSNLGTVKIPKQLTANKNGQQ